MQVETVRSEAQNILNSLPEIKLTDALNYLKFLNRLSEEQLDTLEDFMENLGWSLLASEAIEKE